MPPLDGRISILLKDLDPDVQAEYDLSQLINQEQDKHEEAGESYKFLEVLQLMENYWVCIRQVEITMKGTAVPVRTTEETTRGRRRKSQTK